VNRTRWLLMIGATAAVFAAASRCPGLVTISNGGAWPEDWLPELESVRERATTMEDGREKIHHIPVRSTDEFLGIWYAVLNLKSPGGTLTLTRVGDQAIEWPGTENVQRDEPAVRLYMPNGCYLGLPAAGAAGTSLAQMEELVEQGKALHADAPWPTSAYLENGELAEFVKSEERDGKMTWVPTTEPGWNQRARVDIELIVDGIVIDLNKTPLPPDTRIIDNRGL